MSKKGYNTSVGCLSSIITLVLSGVLYVFVNRFLKAPFYIGYTIALLVASFIVSKSFEYHFKNKRTEGTIRIILTVCILGFVFLIRHNTEQKEKKEFFEQEEQTIAFKDSIIDGEKFTLASHKRYWKDYIGNNYSGSLQVKMEDYYTSAKFHEQMSVSVPEKNFWNAVYTKLYYEDQAKLSLIYDELSRLRKHHQLNNRQFVDMVVSCIQDIPYAFVFQEECLAANQYEKSIKDILESCPECCIGNKKYGIQTPVEFMSNLKGDCDTRTLIIYTILSHFGFDVVILNSNFYKHSILGVNTFGKGLFKRYKGKNYYVWETTNKHFRLGELSAQFNNIKYWHVVLSNK